MKLNLLICILLVVVLFSCQQQAEKTKQPNIILVMADDQGWGQT